LALLSERYDLLLPVSTTVEAVEESSLTYSVVRMVSEHVEAAEESSVSTEVVTGEASGIDPLQLVPDANVVLRFFSESDIQYFNDVYNATVNTSVNTATVYSIAPATIEAVELSEVTTSVTLPYHEVIEATEHAEVSLTTISPVSITVEAIEESVVSYTTTAPRPVGITVETVEDSVVSYTMTSPRPVSITVEAIEESAVSTGVQTPQPVGVSIEATEESFIYREITTPPPVSTAVEATEYSEVSHEVSTPPPVSTAVEVAEESSVTSSVTVPEDSGVSPYDSRWKPDIDYEELYTFHNASDLDRLFNEMNSCCIESNSCWNCGTDWCHRDTGLEDWSYSFKHFVFAVRFERTDTPSKYYVLGIWTFKSGVMDKAQQILFSYDSNSGKMVLEHEYGTLELEWGRWYVIKFTAGDTPDTATVEVWDVESGQKIATVHPKEYSPTYTSDYHAIELFGKDYNIKVLIDWVGITKWE